MGICHELSAEEIAAAAAVEEEKVFCAVGDGETNCFGIPLGVLCDLGEKKEGKMKNSWSMSSSEKTTFLKDLFGEFKRRNSTHLLILN